mgnify:CR=1 FL=1|tara:strand:- start:5583 stop:5843 length:261 start_codon:yes stop_codon:yes gene_type:complete
MEESKLNNMLVEFVSEIMEIPNEEINDEMNPEDFENWDSFNHIKLLLTLEDELSIKFSDEEIEASFNLKNLRNNLLKKIEKKTLSQ